jgi:serine/threonine-protein phosphatase Stp1
MVELPAPMAAGALVSEVRTVIAATHRALRARADAETTRSGAPVIIASTVVVFLASDLHYACLWAGDSRAYRLREGTLLRLTRDHSLVQSLVEDGVLTEAEAETHPHANIVTRALGDDSVELELEKITDRAEVGDRYLLCTDGLTKTLDEARIAVLSGEGDPARQLITAALDSGARDNITAIVLECGAAQV